MADAVLHYFWIMVTALFIFSAAYCWFVAIIVRKSLPGEMVWIFLGLAWITGSNAFIRSGEMVIDPETVQIISRAMFLMVGISSCVAAVQLGRCYNGDVSGHIPLSRQWRMLRRGMRQDEGDDDAKRASFELWSDCDGDFSGAGDVDEPRRDRVK